MSNIELKRTLNELDANSTSSWFDKFAKYSLDEGIEFSRCSNSNWELWQKTSNEISFLPIEYEEFFIQYQLAYMTADFKINDFSVVILQNKKPIGIWPLVLLEDHISKKPIKLGSNSGAILNPLFIKTLELSSCQRIEKAVLKALLNFCQNVGISNLAYSEMLGPICGYTSTFHSSVMRIGSNAQVSHFLYVDLLLPIEKIRANYRKRFRSFIHEGERIWEVHILDQANNEVWEEFKNLHFEVAGRATRSNETWDLQYETLVLRKGFLVFLRDQSERMVGGGFFQHTRDEGLYAVGAYDRLLFDKPLGHIVQHTAIVEMKRRGLRWYKIGQRFYPGTVPKPTEKELSISAFKDGFSTHQFVQVNLHTETNLSP